MTVVIRMKRTGRRNRPCYRISVADRRFPRDGKTLETLGLYDPVSKDLEAQVSLNVERAKHWIEQGAKPSETVNSIFERQGVFEGRPEKKKRNRSGRKAAAARRKVKEATKSARAEKKATRRQGRIAARRAAAVAAAESAGE